MICELVGMDKYNMYRNLDICFLTIIICELVGMYKYNMYRNLHIYWISIKIPFSF